MYAPDAKVPAIYAAEHSRLSATGPMECLKILVDVRMALSCVSDLG